MTQRLSAILVGALFLPIVARAAGGATFAPSPSAQNVDVGERFTVDFLVDARGEELDTARAYVQFPPELLRLEDIALGELFPRQSPGNRYDNTEGTVSQGGFILGGTVTGSGTFATATFVALKEGMATVEIEDRSRLISAGEEKGTGSYADATVTISAQEGVVAPSGEAADEVVAPGVAVASLSHPSEDAWYRERAFVADWSAENGATVTRWRTAFDQEPGTEPTTVSSASTISVADVADGIWYLHVNGDLADGGKTETAHYRVRVDGTSPNPIAPSTPRPRYLEGEDALLEFATTDDLSGIDHYELSLNGSEFAPAESPIVIDDLKIGDYFVEVKAVDRAGNERYGKTGIRAYEKGTQLKDEDLAARAVEQTRIAEIRDARDDEGEKSGKLLITLALGVAAVLAIILSISTLRRKKITKRKH